MPSECPYCFGTGRSKRGGPCRQCRATGQIATPMAAAKNTVDVVRAIFVFVVFVVIVAAVIAH